MGNSNHEPFETEPNENDGATFSEKFKMKNTTFPNELMNLFEDSGRIFSNPRGADWTKTPLTVMKMTIDRCEEVLREIPKAIGVEIKQHIDAADYCNQNSRDQSIKEIKTLFYNYDESEGPKGIMVELDSKINEIKIYSSLLKESQSKIFNDVTSVLNNLKQVQGFSKQVMKLQFDKQNLLSELASKDRLHNAEKEKLKSTYLQKISNLSIEIKVYKALGFWGQISNAFATLYQSSIRAILRLSR